MKYFFAITFFLITSSASAQIVNIPDPYFKAELVLLGTDTNQDGEIQTSEALAVTNLMMGWAPGQDTILRHITDLTGIKSFLNLQSITFSIGSAIDAPHITSIDFSDMLSFVNISCNDIPSLATINVTGCTNLKTLSCRGSSITQMNIAAFPNLETLNLDDMQDLIELIADDNPKLKSVNLFASGNTGSYISFKNCDTLSNFAIPGLTAQTLDISGSKLIPVIAGVFDNVIARNCTGLYTIDMATTINNLDVTGCINLQSAWILSDVMQNCDFSSCISLRDLRLSRTNPTPINQTFNLNIKNGSLADVTLSLYCPVNICADEFELDTLALMPGIPSDGSVNISSYCSFFPGGNYNTVKGKIKFDANSNGCDNADAGIGFVPVRITDNSGNLVTRYTAPSGDFAHYPYAGTFTFTPYFPFAYFNLTPASAAVSFDTANSLIDSVSFCISPNGVHNDLEITLLPDGNARPGFSANYHIIYKNRGTTVQSGSVQLNFENSKLNLLATYPVSSNQTTGQLTWNYTNLQPFESRTIYLSFDVLPAPVNNVGDTLTFLTTVNPLVNDETPNDNVFILPQRVRGSFDPNDKICLQGEKLDINNIGNPLDYIIHFQNLGTDTAFNVVVTDTLSNNLDWDSFDFTGSSFPCDVQRKGNKLQFYFRDIHLPYATINEPASHGFVTFKIKPKNSVVIGDSLNNRASIYFDFNVPVVTNLVTTVVSPTSPVPVKLEYFSLSKKNETNLLTWKAPSTDVTTSFVIESSADGIDFTNIGNLTATSQRCQLPFNFTDDKPLPGKNYYRLKITGDNEISFYSKILVTGNNKEDFEIIAITSSNNNTIMYCNSAKQQTIQMKMIAADGKIIYKNSKTILTGSSMINLPLKNMAGGVYTMIVYTNEGATITKRFVK
ncbi:MAG: hypothetical protein ABI402_12850 [Ferruginibacter sp.]